MCSFQNRVETRCQSSVGKVVLPLSVLYLFCGETEDFGIDSPGVCTADKYPNCFTSSRELERPAGWWEGSEGSFWLRVHTCILSIVHFIRWC